jgi:hypothetical protein
VFLCSPAYLIHASCSSLMVVPTFMPPVVEAFSSLLNTSALGSSCFCFRPLAFLLRFHPHLARSKQGFASLPHIRLRC